jgi:PAS domain S-box-containing protein
MNHRATNTLGGLAIGLQLHLKTNRATAPREGPPLASRWIGLPPLLAATLESATDGVIIVDCTGKVICYNSRFLAMWGIPTELMERGTYLELATFAAARTCHHQQFLERELDTPWNTEGCDAVFLPDGRVFERQLQPQWMGGECVGRIVTFRDITGRTQINPSETIEESTPPASLLATPPIESDITEPAQYVCDNLSFLQEAFCTLQAVLELYPELLQAAKNNAVSPELLARAEAALKEEDLNYLREHIPRALRDTATGITEVLGRLQTCNQLTDQKMPSGV